MYIYAYICMHVYIVCICIYKYIQIYLKTDRKLLVYYHFGVNVLRWCPFDHLFDTPFQKFTLRPCVIILFLIQPVWNL